MELPARKYFMNFCEKVPKKCVLAAYHMRGLFRNNNDVVIRKHFVNFCKSASKNCVLVAYTLRGLFSSGNRSKRKNLSDQIEGVIAGRKISSPLNKKICEGG